MSSACDSCPSKNGCTSQDSCPSANGIAKDPLASGSSIKTVIGVASGKGGVGKTTSSASISSGLALEGKKTAVIDFDVGLRNLDLVMGCERRVVYDLVNVIKKEATLRQALIKDKN